jgi:transcriptional regulator with XRE-family HTH domain
MFRVVAAASILAFGLTAHTVAVTYAADDGLSADPLPTIVEPPVTLPDEPPSEPPTTDPLATDPPVTEPPPVDDAAPAAAPDDATDPTATAPLPTDPDGADPADGTDTAGGTDTASDPPAVDPPPPDTTGDVTADVPPVDVPPVDVPPVDVPPVDVPPDEPVVDPGLPPEVSGTPIPADAGAGVAPVDVTAGDSATAGDTSDSVAGPSTASSEGAKALGSDATVTPSKERLAPAPTAEPSTAPRSETVVSLPWRTTGPERASRDEGWNAAAAVGAAIAAGVVVTNQAAQGTLTVAMEFGRAGGGWAGAIVFNIWLRRQLRERRMSQRQLAALSGVDHSTISRLLRDGRQPSLATATKLVSALRGVGVDPDEPNAASYFERMPEDTVFPARRVEQALRADEQLPEEEVRRLMRIYLDARRRYEPVARGSATMAASSGTRTARAAPPGRG